MDENNSNTGATPTAGSIQEAVARLRESREKGQSQSGNGTGDDDTNRANATSNGAGAPDDEGHREEPTGDGTGDADANGDGTTPPDGDGTNAPDDNGFALDSWKPEELDRPVKLKVGDETVETTLREALRGHMRQADYTRKTEEVAKLREQTKQAEAAYVGERTRYSEVLSMLEPIIEQQVGGRTEAEWNQLREEDPQAYLLEREQFAQRKQQLEAVKAERQRVAQEQQMQFVAQHTERMQSEAEKFDRAFGIAPGDSKARAELSRKHCDYLRANGLTDADINQIFDHRAFILIDKAMKHDATEAARKVAESKRAGQQKPMQAGAGAQTQVRVTGKDIEAKKAASQLKKTGSISDAAAALRAQREASQQRR